MTAISGIINLDKPAGISSAGAVAKVKRLLPRGTRIGHAGTLDPFATGVLLLLVGSCTRRCESLMDLPKQYETTLKLGATTITLDPTAPEIVAEHAAPADDAMVREILPRFVGAIEQIPPDYSALKIAGRPAYKLARQGRPVRLEPRIVRVYGIDLLDYRRPLLSLRIDCGRGTYIRSLARDIGLALGTTAYLQALRRTAIGEYRSADAVPLEVLLAEGVDRHLRA
jgi:tRNA pseudouridine55 synthase